MTDNLKKYSQKQDTRMGSPRSQNAQRTTSLTRGMEEDLNEEEDYYLTEQEIEDLRNHFKESQKKMLEIWDTIE